MNLPPKTDAPVARSVLVPPPVTSLGVTDIYEIKRQRSKAQTGVPEYSPKIYLSRSSLPPRPVRELVVPPQYEYEDVVNGPYPYMATLSIDGTAYATGYGNSKKAAKNSCATLALDVLTPDYRAAKESAPCKDDMSFFDEIRVEDPRVAELSTTAGLPTPYSLLNEALKVAHLLEI